MRKLLVVLFVLAFVTFTQAGWNHAETVFNFANDDSMLVGGTGSISGEWWKSSDPHGVVIDAEGKIWIAMHSGYGPDQAGSTEFWGRNMADPDSVFMDTCHYKPLYCFNSDGTPASFSPITMFTFPDGSKDTLYSESYANGSGKGISLDMDGNVLYTAYSTVYLINYQTGAGIARFIPSSLGSMTEAVQDPVNGFIYVGYVVPSNRPIYMLDGDLDLIGNAVDTTKQITRSLAVKTAGGVTTLYNGTTWSGNGIMTWESADPEFEAFVPVDTLGNLAEYTVGDTTYLDVKMWSSSLDWTPDGNLLVGALRQSWAGPLGSQWWIFDPVNDEYLEHFGVPVDDENANAPDGFYLAGGVNGPRGGFFTDANTVYTIDFYLRTLDKWTWTAAIDNDVVILDKFALKQNYPNPFNPTTVIPFILEKSSIVRLTIYDMLGREIETLLDNKMNPGNYKINFDATGLASGTYVYRLDVDG
ncbi:MAG: T9SS type A sorting domain-containing protein, partial [Candidatus Marinimicrobia bacterium]|nr:T9SS type A sorting domain-containing protein [Candidatus Neomarinimicrobiota bacterium]